MAGAGSKRMGGLGAKPTPPRTAMAGKPAGGPPAVGGGLGAPGPRPPAAPRPAPPMGGAGAPPPMPGGAPPVGGGGMGGSGGFEAGGAVGAPMSEPSKFAKGGIVGGGDAKGRVGRDTGKASKSD